MRYTIQQKIFMVKSFTKWKLTESTFRNSLVNAYKNEFLKSFVYWMLSKSHRPWFLLWQNEQFKMSLLIEEKVQDIQTWSNLCPHTSLRYLAQETGVSLGSGFTATRIIKFRTWL